MTRSAAPYLRCHFHPVVWDADGNGIYRMDNDEDWPCPSQGFTGRSVIAGRRVKCLSPEVLMLCRAGYGWADKDYRDTAAIHARFGVPYPSGYGPEDSLSRQRDQDHVPTLDTIRIFVARSMT